MTTPRFRLLSEENLEIRSIIKDTFQTRISETLHIHFKKLSETQSDANAKDEPAVILGDGVVRDSEWYNVIQSISQSMGSKGAQHIFQNLFDNPSYIRTNVHNSLHSQSPPTIPSDLINAMPSIEHELLWILNTTHDYPMNLLFPKMFLLNKLNFSSEWLFFVHFYKILASPMAQAVMPLSSIIAPYFLLRRQMGIRLTFKVYLKMMYILLMQGIRSQMQPGIAGAKNLGIKFGSLAIYALMYLYGILNAIDYAHQTYNARKYAAKRSYDIRATLQIAKKNLDLITSPIFDPYVAETTDDDKSDIHQQLDSLLKIRGTFPFIYECLRETRKPFIKFILSRLYGIEIYNHLKETFVPQNGWCQSMFNNSLTSPPIEFYAMAHPLLPDHQKKNPFRFDKTIIMTGPNAAGKSTYARAALINTLLGITFGFCKAKRASIGPIHSIFTHMRLQDVSGIQSLFEAEIKSCQKLLQTIERTRPWSLVFLDEPMHSTNPIEGAAATVGLIKKISSLAGVRAIITTHYPQVIDIPLENVYHLSMEATKKDGKYEFPYKIKKGASKQYIALELLQESVQDDTLLADAIKIKNKITSSSKM